MTHVNRKTVCISTAAIALAFMLSGSVGAFYTHENKLTFSRAVALPGGIVLPAGTYSFDIAKDNSLALVVVRNAGRSEVFYRGMTTSVIRPAGMSRNISIVMGEAPNNEAAPITTWYELGTVDGHQFKY